MKKLETYKVNIRKATHSDLEAVYEVEVRSFKDPYPMHFLKMLYYLSPVFLVATENDSVIGYVVAILRRRSLGHIISIAVHPSHRKKGVGRRLLLEALSMLSRLKVKKCRLEVRESNLPALKLYKSIGFEETYSIKNYYGDGERAIVMFKEL